MPRNRTALIVVALSSLFYVGCLLLPAFDCGPDNKSFPGYIVLAVGYLNLLAFDPRWFANPLLFIMLLKLGLGKPGENSLLPFLASTLAISSFFFEAPGCGFRGGAPEASKGLAIGGYLWVVTVVFTSVCYIVIAEKNRKVEANDNVQS